MPKGVDILDEPFLVLGTGFTQTLHLFNVK
jgi:hypothetical protein